METPKKWRYTFGLGAPPGARVPAMTTRPPDGASGPTTPPEAAARGAAPRPTRTRSGPAVRIDALRLFVRCTSPSGVPMEIRPPGRVTAAREHALPVFDGWLCGELVVRAEGLCDRAFSAGLAIDGAPTGKPAPATVDEGPGGVHRFAIDLAVPLRALEPLVAAPSAGARRAPPEPKILGLWLGPARIGEPTGARVVSLFPLSLVPIAATGPRIASVDLHDVTDSLLFDAPERRLFDLQNPEEGIWRGTGKWRLRLVADWVDDPAASGASPGSRAYALDPRPSQIRHPWERSGDGADLLVEDAGRRAGTPGHTHAELVFDASSPALGDVPDEGKDVALDLAIEHALSFAVESSTVPAVLTWRAPVPIRVRDPRPLRKVFERLSAVGIDFGTTATVAALYQKGYRSLMRLGSSRGGAMPAENPTYLLVEDHERLWAELERAAREGTRFPDLLRVVRGSHAAREAMADVPSAVVGELKSLPERVLGLDQSPQLRDRERQRDFLLDEARVRALVRTYAYLLSRAINRPGQDVYLHYWLTHPAKSDAKATKLLEEEIRAGILLGIPEGIPADAVTVSMSASEPEAFAAEVCPELAAHPALEPLVTRFGELRFCVFDFGGGTLDIACGRFRPATPEEQDASGSSTVIETLQVSGDDHLGGEYLTHELVWLTHQHERHLPEMLEKEVPMMRPPTVPPNNLVSKPHLYKRSLAGRQNRFRFERELGLERVKAGPTEAPRCAASLVAARLDGSEVALESLGSDLAGLHARLAEHLEARIREGVKLMRSVLRMAPWGGPDGGASDWREQGVVILLAGNSSRSAFVERALAEELGIADLQVWRPGSPAPFQQVVLYETPERVERGVSIVGVTPKTAVALGALKIANHEVHLARRTQGFSYFLGDLRGFPPKFHALVPMGAPAGDPEQAGPHWTAIGRWDSKMPLRVAKEYEPGRMTSSDPRIVLVPTGLPPGAIGTLYACVAAPEEIVLLLEREGQEPLRATVNLAKHMR